MPAGPGQPPGVQPSPTRHSAPLAQSVGVLSMEPSQSVIGASFGVPRASEPEVDSAELLRALMAVRNGDFSVRLASDRSGIAGKIADTFNEIVAAKQSLATELERVGDVVGKRGQTR